MLNVECFFFFCPVGIPPFSFFLKEYKYIYIYIYIYLCVCVYVYAEGGGSEREKERERERERERDTHTFIHEKLSYRITSLSSAFLQTTSFKPSRPKLFKIHFYKLNNNYSCFVFQSSRIFLKRIL